MDSIVGIATRYVLDGPAVESRCGRDIPHPSRPAVEHTSSFRVVKRSGRGIDHPPHVASGLKKE